MKKILKRLLYYFLILLVLIVAYFVYIFNDLTSISKGVPIPDYAETQMTVLVIDIQEGYTGKYANEDVYVMQSVELIENTNQVISFAYDSGIPVVYIQQHIVNKLINWLDGSMAQGSPGVAIDERIKIVSLHQFKKRKSDAFSSHDLDRFLVEMKINSLLITGLDLAGCVYRTSVAALNRGYEVYIVEEAVISESDELKNEKLAELHKNGAQVIKLAELHELLK